MVQKLNQSINCDAFKKIIGDIGMQLLVSNILWTKKELLAWNIGNQKTSFFDIGRNIWLIGSVKKSFHSSSPVQKWGVLKNGLVQLSLQSRHRFRETRLGDGIEEVVGGVGGVQCMHYLADHQGVGRVVPCWESRPKSLNILTQMVKSSDGNLDFKSDWYSNFHPDGQVVCILWIVCHLHVPEDKAS